MSLSPKQAAFVREYLVDSNATEAAKRAGYSPKTAAEQGSRLLRKVKILDAIAAGQKALAATAQINAERVIRELATIAFADLGQLYDADGQLLPVNQLPEEARRALAGIKILKGDGSGILEYKLWNKVDALEKLGKHLGLFREQMDVDMAVEVVETVVSDRQQAKTVLAALRRAGQISGQ